MPTRVTGSELKEILTTDKSDELLESQFITTANLFVDEFLSSVGLSDAILGRIELYIAAHFLALSEEGGGLIVDHFGDSTQRYADVFKDGGLKSTRFGQAAIMMDTSNTLEKLTTKLKAQFRVV